MTEMNGPLEAPPSWLPSQTPPPPPPSRPTRMFWFIQSKTAQVFAQMMCLDASVLVW